MKKLSYSYTLDIAFSEAVCMHHYTVKCEPVSNERQTILSSHLEVSPANEFMRGMDSFGNRCLYGCVKEPHETFRIELSGEALTGLSDKETVGTLAEAMLFRYQTKRTMPGIQLQNFAIENGMVDDPGFDALAPLVKAEIIRDRIFEVMEYVPGTTDVATDAEQAFAKKKGVCQDYAQIMLSILRMQKIPARYVVGLLCGEGASHAWVEVYCDGAWYGFDPTNKIPVAEDHIKLTHGRDREDCRINYGLFRGMAVQESRVKVRVFEQ